MDYVAGERMLIERRREEEDVCTMSYPWRIYTCNGINPKIEVILLPLIPISSAVVFSLSSPVVPEPGLRCLCTVPCH